MQYRSHLVDKFLPYFTVWLAWDIQSKEELPQAAYKIKNTLHVCRKQDLLFMLIFIKTFERFTHENITKSHTRTSKVSSQAGPRYTPSRPWVDASALAVGLAEFS